MAKEIITPEDLEIFKADLLNTQLLSHNFFSWFDSH
jgi:hypothetical protein